jgi:hypothetical protein
MVLWCKSIYDTSDGSLSVGPSTDGVGDQVTVVFGYELHFLPRPRGEAIFGAGRVDVDGTLDVSRAPMRRDAGRED